MRTMGWAAAGSAPHRSRRACRPWGGLLRILGVAVPAAIITATKDSNDIPHASIQNLTPAEEHGRELFGERCYLCHTLKAANAVAQVGPNLDQLQPNKALVLNAIQNGRS